MKNEHKVQHHDESYLPKIDREGRAGMTTDRAELAKRLLHTDCDCCEHAQTILSQREAEIGVLKEALKRQMGFMCSACQAGVPFNGAYHVESDGSISNCFAAEVRTALRTSSETGGAWVKLKEAAAKVHDWWITVPRRDDAPMVELWNALSALNRSEAG